MSWRRVVARVMVLAAPVPLPGQHPGEEPRDRVALAQQAIRRDSAEQYLAAWRRALGRTRGGRLATLGTATIARRMYRYAEADARYRSLRDAAGDTVDDIAVQALLGEAQGLITRWQPVQARVLLERAAAAARALHDPTSEGEALGQLAGLAGRLGAVDSARRLMSRAAALIPGGTAASAVQQCSHGAMVRGASLKTADSLVTAGIALARAIPDTLALARCLVVRGTVLEGQGRIGDADEPLREAIAMLESAREWEGVGAAQQWMAYLTITYAQEFGVGRRWAERAIVNGRRSGNPLVVAWARLNLAQAALRVGDAVSGLRAAREAGANFRRIGDPSGEVASRGIEAEALMLAGRVSEALDRYAAQESVLVAMGAPNAVPMNKLRRAAGLLELGRTNAAEQAIDSAVALATTHGIRGIVTSSQHYARGLLALRRGEWDRAIEAFLQFKRGVGANPAHLNLDADLRIAEALARSGRFAAAESVFARGSASLDNMRATAPGRDDVLRLLSGLRYDMDTDLGVATIVSLLADGGRLDGAFGIAESERARWLWIRRARRRAMAARPAAPEPLDERVLELADIRRRIDSGTAVLSYVTGRGGEPTTLFALWRDGARAFHLTAIDSLAADIARFAIVLEGGGSSRVLARSLAARLVDSALAVLPPGIRNLRIVPDGPLHHLPFDALELRGGQRVLEGYVVSLAPSARLAVAPPPVVSTSTAARRVLAFGDPVFDSRYALVRLPGSAREAEGVVRAAGGRGDVLLRQRARASALQRGTWDGIGAIHFATHARVQDWGLLDNAIFLSGQVDSDGRLGAEDLAGMSLAVDLVVLSGCRTVGGMVATGEGVQGLVAPVLEAGARAVVVTQWDIGDRSLVDLMVAFYRGMATGLTAADALALAKRRSLAAGAPPAVWAAVTLVGDAGVRPLRVSGDGVPAAARPSEPRSRPRAWP